MTQDDDDRGRRAFAAALAGCLALASAMGVGRFVYTPILPFMMEGAGLSPTQAGSIASANFLGYFVGAVAATLPAARAARPVVVVAALAASAATGAAMALASDPLGFAVLRFLSGIASAFVFVGASALVLPALTRAGAPGLSSLHFAGVGLGIALSAALVEASAGSGGWRAPWLTTAAFSALACLAAALLLPREAPAQATSGGPGDGRPVWPMILAYGLWGFGYVVTATFLVALVREAHAGSETLVWLTVGVTAAPSIALWTRFAARVGLGPAFALACLIEAAGVALSALAPGAALVAAALFGGTFMGCTALGLAAARQSAGGDPRRILGVMTTAMSLGQLIGPTLAGLLRERFGSWLAPSLGAAAALVAAAGLGLWWNAARRDP